MDDTTKEFLSSLAGSAARHIGTAAGGYLAAQGLANQDQSSMVAGAIAFLGGLGWSYVEKHWRILGSDGKGGSGPAKAALLALLGIGTLTYGCSSTGSVDLQQVEQDVQAACLAYAPVSNSLATAPQGSSAAVTKGYVDSVCSLAYPGSVTPVGKAVMDPTTAAWVSAGTAALKAAATLLPAPSPAPAAPAAPAPAPQIKGELSVPDGVLIRGPFTITGSDMAFSGGALVLEGDGVGGIVQGIHFSE